jgi:hypothetical protein
MTRSSYGPRPARGVGHAVLVSPLVGVGWAASGAPVFLGAENAYPGSIRSASFRVNKNGNQQQQNWCIIAEPRLASGTYRCGLLAVDSFGAQVLAIGN